MRQMKAKTLKFMDRIAQKINEFDSMKIVFDLSKYYYGQMFIFKHIFQKIRRW